MPSVSIDLTGALESIGPRTLLALVAASVVVTMAWEALKTLRRPRMTLAEEYDLYERALRGARTDEERAALEEVRRSILRRMARPRPPALARAVLENCPVSVMCAAWLAETLAFGGDLARWAAWSLVMVSLEIVKNALGIAVAARGRRGAHGRHFR